MAQPSLSTDRLVERLVAEVKPVRRLLDPTQRAALWARGELAIGPMYVGEHEAFPAIGSPISQVLAHLGAVRRRRDADEFVSVGLDRCRGTDEWLDTDARTR